MQQGMWWICKNLMPFNGWLSGQCWWVEVCICLVVVYFYCIFRKISEVQAAFPKHLGHATGLLVWRWADWLKLFWHHWRSTKSWAFLMHQRVFIVLCILQSSVSMWKIKHVRLVSFRPQDLELFRCIRYLPK